MSVSISFWVSLYETDDNHKRNTAYLLAMEAFLGELLVVAGGAVDVVTLVQEALRADGQLALEALEAVLMPYLLLVLHVLGS